MSPAAILWHYRDGWINAVGVVLLHPPFALYASSSSGEQRNVLGRREGGGVPGCGAYAATGRQGRGGGVVIVVVLLVLRVAHFCVGA